MQGRLTRMLLPGLLLAAPLLHAQSPSAAAERAQQAQEKARLSEDKERQALERELETAQRQLSDAARRLAAAQRKLADTEGRRAARQAVVMEGRPRLGVIVRTFADPAVDPLGAAVEAVTPGGPADAAGLRARDIITAFNGEALARRGEASGGESPAARRLIDRVRELHEGDRVKLEFLRDGKNQSASLLIRAPREPRRIRVSAGEGPDERDIELADFNVPEIPELPELPGMIMMKPAGRFFDVDLVQLSPELGDYFGSTRGMLVVRAPAGNALQLKGGDVIVKINGREPVNAPDAVRMLHGDKPPLRLDILRKKAPMKVEAILPVRPTPAAPPVPPTAPAAPTAPKP